MRSHSLALVAAVASLLVARPQLSAQSAPPSERIGWISGCWARTTATSVVEEQWMTPRAGVLMGMSRTTSNGNVREYEFLRIFTAGDTLVYAATPSGQTYTEFRAIKLAADEVVFENLKHDFPQRIGYRMFSKDSVVAFVEGPRGGTTRRIDYPFTRAVCPAATPF